MRINKIETLQKYLLLLIVFSVPLLILPFLYNIFFIKEFLAYGCISIITLLFLVENIKNERVNYTLYFPALFLVAYLYFYLFSTLFSVYQGLSWGKCLEMIFLVSLFIISAVFTGKSDLLIRIKYAWILAFIVVIFVADYQIVTGRTVSASFGNPNFFGAYILLTIGILSGWILYTWSVKKYGLCLLYGLFVLTGLLFLFFIRSWGAFAGLFFMAVSLIFLTIKKKNTRKYILIIFLVCLALLFLLPGIKNSVINQTEKDVRWFIWPASAGIIMNYPLLGTGPGTFFIVYPDYRIPEYFLNQYSVSATRHAHNHFLEVIAETGILSGICYIAFLLTLLGAGILYWNSLRKKGVQDWLLLGMLVAVIGLLTQNLFSVNLQFTSSYILLWLLLGCIYGRVFLSGKKGEEGYLPGRRFSGVILDTRYSIFKKTITIGFSRGGLRLIKLLLILLIILSYFRVGIRPFMGQIYFHKGIDERNNNRFPKAVYYYGKGLKWFPYAADFWYKLAFAYGNIAALGQAEDIYLHVKKKFGNFSNVNRNLGIVLSRQGRSDQAIFYFKHEKKLNPYDINTGCLLASEYLKMGNKEEALKELKKVLAIDPDNVYAKNNLRVLLEEKR